MITIFGDFHLAVHELWGYFKEETGRDVDFQGRSFSKMEIFNYGDFQLRRFMVRRLMVRRFMVWKLSNLEKVFRSFHSFFHSFFSQFFHNFSVLKIQ